MTKPYERMNIWDELEAEMQKDDDDYKPWSTDSLYKFDKPKKPSGPPKPPTDKDGEPLTAEQIRTALSNLYETMMGIDEIAGDVEDPEEQAKKAKKLFARWRKREKRLEDQLEQAIEFERYELKEKGIVPFGMPTDEGNREITKLVEEQCEWFDNQLDDLKDELADRIRARLDEMGDEANKPEVRDKIYDMLAAQEIIESWEPLEF